MPQHGMFKTEACMRVSDANIYCVPEEID